VAELNVLVLEDDENLRELLCETLEDEGYRAQGAANGVEAIEKVTRQAFDLLIVDVRMEGMSGLEAFAHMRQQGVELACLVITGYATEEDSIRAIRLGVGDYLRKPFEMKELLLRLARVSAVYQRQREGLQREQRLQAQIHWLSQLQSPTLAQQAGQLADQIGAGLQLDRMHRLELQLAAALAHQGLHPQGASHWVGEGLQHWQENWDGSGPEGLAGEAIPLPSRIVRLALLATRNPAPPQELAQQHPGVLDPHLLFTLEFRSNQDHDRHLRRMLDLARGLLYSGQTQEASLALQQAEQLAQGPRGSEVQLLLASLEPAPLRVERLTRLVAAARAWGPNWEARMLLESGLLLIEMRADQATVWIREAYPKLDQPAAQALTQLALWVLGEASDSDWTPLTSIAVLLQPQHEPRLFRILSWLGLPMLRWWLAQPMHNPLLTRWLHTYAGPLVPALARLTQAQRLKLLERLQCHPQGVPTPWLQALVQENDAPVRTLALQLSGRKPEPIKPPPLHIRSFGTFTVFLSGEPVAEKAYRGPRNKLLLAYVAATPRLVPEDRVRETFWPEELEKGKKGLYNGLFNLRKALRPDGWSGECDYFSRRQDQLGLDMELEPWHDLWEVEQSLTRLRPLDWPVFQAELDKIVSLSEGTYLDGCYMDWALERRDALEAQLMEALLAGCQRAAEAEAWPALHDWSQRLLEIEPTQQRAAVYRMRALCQLGRPEEALRTFEGASKRLRLEYEIEPSTEMMEWATRARLWT
jgi:DNA-binding response OmpR family regulator/DNA-binding SARP family transcriptional activator